MIGSRLSLVALALFAVPAEAAAPDDAPVTLEDPKGSLAPFYKALDAGGRIAIVQFGDSHTAGDRFTGRVRVVLQGRFGDAGRGFVMPGDPPIRHYSQRDVRYGTEGAWKAHPGWKRDSVEPYGLFGVRSFASRSSAQAWVETCADCEAGTAVDRFEIFFLRQEDGGVLEARVDEGEWQRIPTALGKDQGATAIPDYATIEVPDGAHRLTLRPRGSKEVDVFGVALERDRPGVVVDALGIVGLMMSHLWSWDWTVIGPQLAHRDPSLVILQYGTNEVDDDDLDLTEFETRYVELIERVRDAVPAAAILILGPPDMAVREHGRKCEKLQKAHDKKRKKLLARQKRKPDPDAAGVPLIAPGCEWKTPSKLVDIIEAERRIAKRTGVAFFDSFRALGGADQIDLLVQAEPPLAYEDHVHLTGKGYAAWADLVLEDLLRGHATWEKLPASKR